MTSIAEVHDLVRPRRPLQGVSILSMVLLLAALALPTATRAPWELLANPAGVTFVALAFLLLTAVAHIIPIGARAKAAVAVAVGVAMLVFASIVGAAAVSGDTFGGQPGVGGVLAGPVGGRIVVGFAVVLLPFGLLWQAQSARPLGPKVAVGAGLGFALLVILAAGSLGLGATTAIASAAETGGASPFLGDRLVAWASLLPMVVAVGAVSTLLPRAPKALSGVLAVAFWVALSLPMVLAALFVAKSEAWALVLEPLKVASFVAVPLIYLPAALAALVTSFDRGRRH